MLWERKERQSVKRHQYDNRGHNNFPFNIFQRQQQNIKKSNEYYEGN